MKKTNDKRQLLKDVLAGKLGLEQAFPSRPVLPHWFSDEETDYFIYIVLKRDRTPLEQQVYEEVIRKTRHTLDLDLWNILEQPIPEQEWTLSQHQQAIEEMVPTLPRFTSEISQAIAKRILEKTSSRLQLEKYGANQFVDDDDLLV
jgi:hypothetical protein